MKQLNIAIVGCGYVANGHVEAWRKVREAKIVAVCDSNEDLAKKMSIQWKIRSYYKSLPELLEKKEAQIIDICTPPQTHALLAVQAMHAGTNVLIEKPMTLSLADAERIASCQYETKLKAGVIHNWLFEPPVVEANRVLRNGRIGDILSAEIVILNTKTDSMTANEHHWSHQIPGGRFGELLPHPIYLIRHFLNEEILHVDVRVSKLGEYSWMKSDELIGVFKTRSKLGMTYVSLNAPRDAILVSLYGKKGILKFDIIDATLNLLLERKTSRFSKASGSLIQAFQLINSTAKNAARIALRRWESGHEMYIRLFAESILRGSDPPVSVQDGLKVMKVQDTMCQMIETSTSNN